MTVVRVTINRRDTAVTANTVVLQFPFSLPLETRVVSLASEGLARTEVDRRSDGVSECFSLSLEAVHMAVGKCNSMGPYIHQEMLYIVVS